MAWCVAPPSPYSLWAGELREVGTGPWSSPRKPKASMSDVHGDSPVKKAAVPLRLKQKTGGVTDGKGSDTQTEGGVTTAVGSDTQTEGAVVFLFFLFF